MSYSPIYPPPLIAYPTIPPNPYGPPQIQAYNPPPPPPQMYPPTPSTTTIIKREASLPAPFSPTPTAQSLPDPSASSSTAPPPKKKVIRFGHGVGSGTTSTYRHKPPVWHPPPTYPYNLIPGRDFDAVVGRPKPVDLSDVFPGEGEGSGVSKPKKKKPAPKVVDVDMEDDQASSTVEMKAEEENGSDFLAPSAEKPPPKKKEKKPKPPPPPSTAPKKPGYREKTEKAKLLDQEREEREKQRDAKTLTSIKSQPKSKTKSVAFQAAHEEPVEEEEELEDVEVDTRLYCVCKQMYDDDRIMIACDNCDDWCHPACVNLPENDLDLVDLFYCPACSSLHNLSTTYKPPCAFNGCNKPARLPLSKFCSDNCGIACVMSRVEEWCALSLPEEMDMGSRSKSKNVNKDVESSLLLGLEASPLVRHAKRREGLVVFQGKGTIDTQAEEERRLSLMREGLERLRRDWAGAVRMISSLQARLALLDVSTQRSETFDSVCGYDPRLGMEEDEWVDWVSSPLCDRAFTQWDSVEEKQGLCQGKKKCDRHGGWQKLKRSDFELELRITEDGLRRIKAKDADLRTTIADVESLRTPPDSASGERVVRVEEREEREMQGVERAHKMYEPEAEDVQVVKIQQRDMPPGRQSDPNHVQDHHAAILGANLPMSNEAKDVPPVSQVTAPTSSADLQTSSGVNTGSGGDTNGKAVIPDIPSQSNVPSPSTPPHMPTAEGDGMELDPPPHTLSPSVVVHPPTPTEEGVSQPVSVSATA